MYGWRVDALWKWIDQRTSGGKKALTMEDLFDTGHLEQYHYLGQDSNKDILTLLTGEEEFNSSKENKKKFLDVGCGIGGPARHMTYLSGHSITGVDIQGCLVEAATKVSERVGGVVGERTKFYSADCTDASAWSSIFKDQEDCSLFDGFFSVLVFLHIPRVPRLKGFENIASILKFNAPFVIEDFVLRPTAGVLTDSERHLLEDIVGASYVPESEDVYRKELESCGFYDIEFEDLSSVWTKWTEERRDRFEEGKSSQIALHGEKHVNDMSTFYAAPAALFKSGKLGGVRITGRKKSSEKEIVDDGCLKKGRAIMKVRDTNGMSRDRVNAILKAQKTVSAV